MQPRKATIQTGKPISTLVRAMLTHIDSAVAITSATSVPLPTVPNMQLLLVTIHGVHGCPDIALYVEFTYAAIISSVTKKMVYMECVERLRRCQESEYRIAALGFSEEGKPDIIVSCEHTMQLVGKNRGNKVTVFVECL